MILFTQALMLLFKIATLREDVSDRFYKILYGKLFSWDLYSTSKKVSRGGCLVLSSCVCVCVCEFSEGNKCICCLLPPTTQTQFLNLLFRAMRDDINSVRVQAFVKRTLQVACPHSSFGRTEREEVAILVPS